MTTPLTRRRHDAAHDRDLNVARIADALEALVDLATGLAPALDAVLDAVATMPAYPEPDEEAEREPGPDDAPASPEDATAWRPTRGVYARHEPEGIFYVDRTYTSEGVDMAVISDCEGLVLTVPAASLSEPRS